MSDMEYMTKVMGILTRNPTKADMNTLVEAHARIGYLSGVYEGEAEMAYTIRKNEEAKAYQQAKNGEVKMTAADAAQLAELEVFSLRKQEVLAKAKAVKVKNMLFSITEAINAIKFVSRERLYENSAIMAGVQDE